MSIKDLFEQRCKAINTGSEIITCILIDLSNITSQEYSFVGNFLYEEEAVRCAKFIRLDLSKKFTICRILARYTLASVVDCDLSQIRFKFEKFGRPFLDEINLDFNISHSNNYGVLCYSAQNKVGVDIEYIDQNFEYSAVLNLCAYKNEIQWINEKDSLIRFYQLWTAKESIMKTFGLGIGSPFPKLEFAEDALIYNNKLVKHMRINNDYCISIYSV